MPEDEGESEGRSPPSLVCKGLLKGLPPGVSFGDSHARRPTPDARAVGPRAEPGTRKSAPLQGGGGKATHRGGRFTTRLLGNFQMRCARNRLQRSTGRRRTATGQA